MTEEPGGMATEISLATESTSSNSSSKIDLQFWIASRAFFARSIEGTSMEMRAATVC